MPSEKFAENFCWPAVQANGDYQGYPMSTSIARPLIAAVAAETALKKIAYYRPRPPPAKATINIESNLGSAP